MEKFVTEGRSTVRGVMTPSGAKNAVLPIMAATLLTTEECVLDNGSLFQDMRTMAKLRGLAVHIERVPEFALT